MPTFKVSKLKEVQLDSADNFSGNEISTTDLLNRETDLTVEVPDGETDTDENPYFTVSTLRGTVGIADYDTLFTDTLNSGDTVEDVMGANSTLFAKLIAEGGTLGGGSVEIRPRVRPAGDQSTPEGLVAAVLHVDHVKHGSVHKVS